MGCGCGCGCFVSSSLVAEGCADKKREWFASVGTASREISENLNEWTMHGGVGGIKSVEVGGLQELS